VGDYPELQNKLDRKKNELSNQYKEELKKDHPYTKEKKDQKTMGALIARKSLDAKDINRRLGEIVRKQVWKDFYKYREHPADYGAPDAGNPWNDAIGKTMFWM